MALATRLGVPFVDADDFHSPANITKMTAGIPLDDHDRKPWLSAIAKRINELDSFVLACSALKTAYRAQLQAARADLAIFHLTAPSLILETRLRERSSHFMPARLLASQLDALETPKTGTVVDTSQSLEACLEKIIAALLL